MIFTLERLTEPDIEPVSLTEMKAHLRAYESVTSEDDAISALITAGREWAENFTGRAFIDQQWRFSFQDYEPANTSGLIVGQLQRGEHGIFLRRSPVIEIVSVNTVDSDNVETLVDSGDYQLLDAGTKWPRIKGPSDTTPTRIVFRAGFADRIASPEQGAELVPNVIKQAIKLWVEAHYDRDEKMMQPLLQAAKSVIRQEICDTGFA